MLQFIRPSSEQLVQRLTELSSKNVDYVVSATDMNKVHTGNTGYRFTFPSKGSMKNVQPTNSAMGQFLSRLKIDVNFFYRCSTTLQERILDEFNVNKRYLFRCMELDLEGRMLCRAVLAPSYPTTHDDVHLYPLVLEALQGLETSIESFYKTAHTSEIIIRFAETATLDGETATACLSVSNSETGHSSIWIEPILKVPGHVYLGSNSPQVARIIHRGTLPTLEELKSEILKVRTQAQVGILQYLEGSQRECSPSVAFNYLDQVDALPKRLADVIKKEWEVEDWIKKSKMIQRVLEAAKELPILQQMAVRRQTGRFVRLFEDSASKLAEYKSHLK